MRSDRPYAAIAEGLAILPALQEKLRTTQGKLKAELPEFCSHQLKTLVETRAKAIAKDIASAVTRELFDDQLGPLLTGFRAQGGSVASLKKRVSSVTLSFEPRLRSLVQERVSVLADGLPGEVKVLVTKWLDLHGIAAPDDQMVVDRPEAMNTDGVQVDVPDFCSSIIDLVACFTAGIIVSVVAMICGGGGLALIASGPIGWIIGAILGLVVAALMVTYGAEKAKEMATEWNVPPWMLKLVITDKKIAEVREKLSNDLASIVEGQLSQMQSALEEQVIGQVEREIDSLNEINQL
jgi:molecular chaperone DnaK